MSPSEFNLQAQLACARRELSKRGFVYPRLVATGKMQHADANRELACMEAILITLTKLLAEEDKRNNPTLFDRIAPQ